jgi:hexosaminidase
VGGYVLLQWMGGSNTRFGDKKWLGFWGDDLEITITFPRITRFPKF